MYLIEKFNEFLNSDLILEYLTPQQIYDKHFKDIPLNVFNKIVDSDPTTIIKVAYDNTNATEKAEKLGQYVKWIAREYKAGRIKEEDIYKLEDTLEAYHNLKKKGLLDKLGIEKDINKYKNYRNLYNDVKDYIEMDEEDEELLTNTALMKKVKEQETEKVFEDEEWLVLKPKTHRSACYYGKNTRWCTASKYDEGTFSNYMSQGDLYINIDKKENEKYQFHFETGQFMDEEDEPIDIYHFFKHQAPQLKEYYTNNYNENICLKVINKCTPKPISMKKIDGENFIIFDDWNDFTSLFGDDKETYVGNVTGGDGHEYFEYHDGLKYQGYENVDEETIKLIKDKINDYINKHDIDIEYNPEELDDLSDIYDFCKDDADYELDEFVDAINISITQAQESADLDEAYMAIIKEIEDKFKITDDNRTYNQEEGKHYCKIDSPNHIISFDDYLNAIDDYGEDYDEEILKLELNEPRYGYTGDINDGIFSEYLKDKINEL